MKIKGRIGRGRRENPGLDEKTRVGVPTPVLKITKSTVYIGFYD